MDVFPFSRGAVQTAIEEFDLLDIRIYEDYSGRGMYGKEALGFVVPDVSLVVQLLLVLSSKLDSSGFNSLLKVMSVAYNMRTDSMGRDIIVYFPDFHGFLDDEEDED